MYSINGPRITCYEENRQIKGYEVIMNYDYPVVMGVGVIATFLTLIGIFLSDIAYAFVDPRIRVGGEK